MPSGWQSQGRRQHKVDNNKQSLAADATKQSLAADATNNPIVPPQAAQSAPNPAAPAPEDGSKKMIIMLVAGVVVILAVVGGIYMFLSKQQPATPPQTTQTNPAPSKPTIAQIKDALDLELDSINVEASEGDFKSVDSDLQSL